ncbi:MAG: tetratricopeptide repeat protein [Chitinophagales bacterium]|nr:tetratricopeptide repeat protein [Chitinophagales bacterium]
MYGKGSFYNAAEYYNAALSKTKKTKQLLYLNYQSGLANYQLRDYKQAKKRFSALTELDKKGKYAKGTYYLADAQKHLGEYEDAKKTYLSFLDATEKSSKVDFERSRARLELKGCDMALEYKNDNPAYTVKNAGSSVNGPFSDFGPEIRSNDLVFSKINSTNVIELDGKQNEDAYSKLYASENV